MITRRPAGVHQKRRWLSPTGVIHGGPTTAYGFETWCGIDLNDYSRTVAHIPGWTSLGEGNVTCKTCPKVMMDIPTLDVDSEWTR